MLAMQIIEWGKPLECGSTQIPSPKVKRCCCALRRQGFAIGLPPMISPIPGAKTSIAATVRPSSFNRM
jgi:hypothetical protein